jgi:hypothetical protein
MEIDAPPSARIPRGPNAHLAGSRRSVIRVATLLDPARLNSFQQQLRFNFLLAGGFSRFEHLNRISGG